MLVDTKKEKGEIRPARIRTRIELENSRLQDGPSLLDDLWRDAFPSSDDPSHVPEHTGLKLGRTSRREQVESSEPPFSRFGDEDGRGSNQTVDGEGLGVEEGEGGLRAARDDELESNKGKREGEG